MAYVFGRLKINCNYSTFYFVSILVSAFVGTALAFACFSGAAMLARRREYLYLGGLLSSGLSMLLWLHFASSIFGGSTAIFKFEVQYLLHSFFLHNILECTAELAIP